MPTSAVIDLFTLTQGKGFIVQGDAAGDFAGYSVSSAGDVNGDGIDDLIVGARYGNDGGQGASEAYVIYGKAGATRGRLDLTGLSASDGFIIQGDAAGDEAGRSVSSAGDVNGDGFDDLIVGAPFGDDGGRDAGEAYVIYGKSGATRGTVDLTGLTASDGFIIQGDRASDYAGRSVSSAGDLNGDGFDDLIVGATGGDDGGDRAGEAYVIYGKAGATRGRVDLTGLAASDGFVIQGDAAGDFAGYSVSSAGDVNGDGIDDMIVGAPSGGDGGRGAGEAYVIYGKAGATRGRLDLTGLSASDGFIIQGDAAYAYAGHSVSSAGDVNGDGIDDLIVGAPFGDDGGLDAGEAYVIYGKSGATRGTVDLTGLSASDGFIIQGDAAGDRAGHSVSSAGDVNGDGIDDLILGAPEGSDGGNAAGEAYVIYGKAGATRGTVDLTGLAASDGFIIQGDAADDFVGWSVSSAGDVNGDGIDDLIVGAPYGDDGGNGAGEAYVIYGFATGTVGTGSIKGRVFKDGNDNSEDDAEAGVGGVTVNLLNAAGVIIDTTVTPADGYYSFTGLAAGSYMVQFPTYYLGQTLVDPNVGPDATDSDAGLADGKTGPITLGAGQRVSDVDAGFEDPGTTTAPVITSNGGGATAVVSVADEGTLVALNTATDADAGATITWSLAGGADAALFTINAATGALSFCAAPDFDAPGDKGANNVYNVTVRASDGSLFDEQALAVRVVDRILETTSAIFAREGKSSFFAALAHAAYHQAADEPGGARNDKVARDLDAAWDARDEVLHSLSALDLADLPGLDVTTLDGWTNGLRSDPAAAGLYTSANGAAFVARSKDALFVSFRGTNNAFDGLYDQADWFTREAHFALFQPLLEAIESYVDAAGSGIRTVYLTGHSLGAAMVQPSFDWLTRNLDRAKIEGVTFASPGYDLDLTFLGDRPNKAITNFWNAADVINFPAALSTIYGSKFTFNDVISNLLQGIGPIDGHSVVLYRAMVDFLAAEGRDANFNLDLDGLLALQRRGLDRIAASIEKLETADQLEFRIGEGSDIVFGGAAQIAYTVVATIPDLLLAPYKAANLVVTSIGAYRDAATSLTSDLDTDEYGAAEDFLDLFSWENAKIILDIASLFLPWIKVAETVLDIGAELYGEDLVVGGASHDILYGLGGSDVIFGGSEGDVIAGGFNNDSLFGGSGDDIISGSTGHDYLAGGLDNDTLSGGSGTDTLSGGEGNDILEGGSGPDQLFGGGGSDIYVVSDASDFVVENPNSGNDLVISSISYTLPQHVERLILDDRSKIVQLFTNVSGTGNSLDNVITGNRDSNTLSGLGGDDVISGMEGRDDVQGGDGDDILFGDIGSDTLNGGANDDTLDGGVEKDDLTGGSGADTFLFRSLAETASDWITDFDLGVDVIDLSVIASGIATGLQFIGTDGFSGAAGEIRFLYKKAFFGSDFTRIQIDGNGDSRPDALIDLAQIIQLTVDSFDLGLTTSGPDPLLT